MATRIIPRAENLPIVDNPVFEQEEVLGFGKSKNSSSSLIGEHRFNPNETILFEQLHKIGAFDSDINLAAMLKKTTERIHFYLPNCCHPRFITVIPPRSSNRKKAYLTTNVQNQILQQSLNETISQDCNPLLGFDLYHQKNNDNIFTSALIFFDKQMLNLLREKGVIINHWTFHDDTNILNHQPVQVKPRYTEDSLTQKRSRKSSQHSVVPGNSADTPSLEYCNCHCCRSGFFFSKNMGSYFYCDVKTKKNPKEFCLNPRSNCSSNNKQISQFDESSMQLCDAETSFPTLSPSVKLQNQNSDSVSLFETRLPSSLFQVTESFTTEQQIPTTPLSPLSPTFTEKQPNRASFHSNHTNMDDFLSRIFKSPLHERPEFCSDNLETACDTHPNPLIPRDPNLSPFSISDNTHSLDSSDYNHSKHLDDDERTIPLLKPSIFEQVNIRESHKENQDKIDGCSNVTTRSDDQDAQGIYNSIQEFIDARRYIKCMNSEKTQFCYGTNMNWTYEKFVEAYCYTSIRDSFFSLETQKKKLYSLVIATPTQRLLPIMLPIEIQTQSKQTHVHRLNDIIAPLIGADHSYNVDLRGETNTNFSHMGAYCLSSTKSGSGKALFKNTRFEPYDYYIFVNTKSSTYPYNTESDSLVDGSDSQTINQSGSNNNSSRCLETVAYNHMCWFLLASLCLLESVDEEKDIHQMFKIPNYDQSCSASVKVCFNLCPVGNCVFVKYRRETLQMTPVFCEEITELLSHIDKYYTELPSWKLYHTIRSRALNTLSGDSDKSNPLQTIPDRMEHHTPSSEQQFNPPSPTVDDINYECWKIFFDIVHSNLFSKLSNLETQDYIYALMNETYDNYTNCHQHIAQLLHDSDNRASTPPLSKRNNSSSSVGRSSKDNHHSRSEEQYSQSDKFIDLDCCSPKKIFKRMLLSAMYIHSLPNVVFIIQEQNLLPNLTSHIKKTLAISETHTTFVDLSKRNASGLGLSFHKKRYFNIQNVRKKLKDFLGRKCSNINVERTDSHKRKKQHALNSHEKTSSLPSSTPLDPKHDSPTSQKLLFDHEHKNNYSSDYSVSSRIDSDDAQSPLDFSLSRDQMDVEINPVPSSSCFESIQSSPLSSDVEEKYQQNSIFEGDSKYDNDGEMIEKQSNPDTPKQLLPNSVSRSRKSHSDKRGSAGKLRKKRTKPLVTPQSNPTHKKKSLKRKQLQTTSTKRTNSKHIRNSDNLFESTQENATLHHYDEGVYSNDDHSFDYNDLSDSTSTRNQLCLTRQSLHPHDKNPYRDHLQRSAHYQNYEYNHVHSGEPSRHHLQRIIYQNYPQNPRFINHSHLIAQSNHNEGYVENYPHDHFYQTTHAYSPTIYDFQQQCINSDIHQLHNQVVYDYPCIDDSGNLSQVSLPKQDLDHQIAYPRESLSQSTNSLYVTQSKKNNKRKRYNSSEKQIGYPSDISSFNYPCSQNPVSKRKKSLHSFSDHSKDSLDQNRFVNLESSECDALAKSIFDKIESKQKLSNEEEHFFRSYCETKQLQ